MNKAVSLSIFVLLVCMAGDTKTISYPAKSVLKKADHIASLAITATFISSLIASAYDYNKLGEGIFVLHLIALTTNSIVNGMALKHERSIAAILKFLLPVGTFAGSIVFSEAVQNSDLESAAFSTMITGLGVNGIKNIWDVYSLAKYNQIESAQHDA